MSLSHIRASGEYGQPTVEISVGNDTVEAVKRLMHQTGWHQMGSGHYEDHQEMMFMLSDWSDECIVKTIGPEDCAIDIYYDSEDRAVFTGTFRECCVFSETHYNDTSEYRIFDYSKRDVTHCDITDDPRHH